MLETARLRLFCSSRNSDSSIVLESGLFISVGSSKKSSTGLKLNVSTQNKKEWFETHNLFAHIISSNVGDTGRLLLDNVFVPQAEPAEKPTSSIEGMTRDESGSAWASTLGFFPFLSEFRSKWEHFEDMTDKGLTVRLRLKECDTLLVLIGILFVELKYSYERVTVTHFQ
jgi:hypothetical protein